MNLYEMNKIMVHQLPKLEITDEVLKSIDKLHEIHNAHYYMLLCNDMKYYTILKPSIAWAMSSITQDTFGVTVVDCLNCVGEIKAIDLVNDNTAIEIWIECKDNEEGEIYCMYLFPYDEGVVEFRG